MTEENRRKYDAKKKRVEDAIALKEPDQIPIIASADLFAYSYSGYTVAEVVYDTSLEKLEKSIVKYMTDFDPDNGAGSGFMLAGEGPMMELSDPKNMRWAGMPGDIIDKNSIQQFIEFPVLLEDEFDEFFSDRTGWRLKKQFPRTSALLEPLSTIDFVPAFSSARRIAHQFSTPDVKKMIETLWRLDELYNTFQKNSERVAKTVHDMGFPVFTGSLAGVPFDSYSDNLRGTLLSLSDLYLNPEHVEKFTEAQHEATLNALRASKGVNDGCHVFMALHKGMDGFMSDEHYRNYYWKHLQEIIVTIIECGKVPYIYTEGKYNARLDCLTEVPTGKVFYHFEEVDMAVAKSKLGSIACIAGGFRSTLLDWGTPEQVRDEVKRLIDICAPGGGFIFSPSAGINTNKAENVEAMFDTLKIYGKY